MFLICLTSLLIRLNWARVQPVSAIVVLGGSIRREIAVTDWAKSHPQLPILISQGSEDPCIWLLFDRVSAPKDQVFLEKCAQNTFDNFRYSIPFLQRWHASKVLVLTSPTHLPRAQWLAQIMLGSKGFWVEMKTVTEKGIPGNQEHLLKTTLDVIRAGLWSIFNPFLPAVCSDTHHLIEVDMTQWQTMDFKCEHQGGIN